MRPKMQYLRRRTPLDRRGLSDQEIGGRQENQAPATRQRKDGTSTKYTSDKATSAAMKL